MDKKHPPSMHELCLMQVRVDRAMRTAVSARLEAGHLTLMEWLALGVVLKDTRNGVSMSGIAEALDVTLPQVTALVSDLLRMKLIKQKVLAQDRRGRQVILTLKGRRTLRRLEDSVAQAMGEWSKDIAAEQLEAYVRTVLQLGSGS